MQLDAEDDESPFYAPPVPVGMTAEGVTSPDAAPAVSTEDGATEDRPESRQTDEETLAHTEEPTEAQTAAAITAETEA